MNFLKRVTTLIGVIALMASGLLASGSMAQSIGTTITVENNPACVPAGPTSLVMNQGAESVTWGTLPSSGTSANNANLRMRMDLHVDECLAENWRVDVAITDFHNGPNSVAAAGKLQMFADNNQVFEGMPASIFTHPVYLADPGSSQQFRMENRVPGTTGLPNSGLTFGSALTFSNSGPNHNVASGTLSTGTSESHGDMVQVFRLRVVGVPNTVPAGTYEADLMVTFTSTGP